MVPSVFWLKSALCYKSSFWVVPFTCYSFQCCLAPKVLSAQKWIFYVVPFICYGPQCCLAPTCFPLKINIFGGSLHFSWSRLPSVVWLQSDLCSICWTVELNWMVSFGWNLKILDSLHVWKISDSASRRPIFFIHVANPIFQVSPSSHPVLYQTCYVGSGHKYFTECTYLIPHLHICSDWLITKKSNIQSSEWAILVKLGMWVVMGTSSTHVVCRHQMCIFNTSFSYLFWLANNQKVEYPEFWMGYIDETWYVGSDGHKFYPWGLSSPNAHI